MISVGNHKEYRLKSKKGMKFIKQGPRTSSGVLPQYNPSRKHLVLPPIVCNNKDGILPPEKAHTNLKCHSLYGVLFM